MLIYTEKSLKNKDAVNLTLETLDVMASIEFANRILSTCDLGFISFCLFSCHEIGYLVLPKTDEAFENISCSWHTEVSKLFSISDDKFWGRRANDAKQKPDSGMPYYEHPDMLLLNTLFGDENERSLEVTIEDDGFIGLDDERIERIVVMPYDPPQLQIPPPQPFRLWMDPSVKPQPSYRGIGHPYRFIDLMPVSEFLDNEWHEKAIGLDLTKSGKFKGVTVFNPQSWDHPDLELLES